jgi:hypothetical protein
MLIEEITEGYIAAWGRKPGGRMVRRYRCTTGKKKGRVVAKPTTCTTAISPSKSATLKKTRRATGAVQALRRSMRMKHPTSRRLARANRSMKFQRLKRRRK